MAETDEAVEGVAEPAKKSSNIIYLTLLNGTGYVFEVEDYMELRQRHRILGSLVGTANNRGWAVHENTLPVELMSWETQLLVEQNIAQLVSKREALLRQPTQKELEELKRRQDALHAQQAQLLKAEKLEETRRNMQLILAGKRRKLDQENTELNEAQILRQTADNFVYEPQHMLSQICCAHPEPHVAQLCRLPTDRSLKYCVFRDCWLRGKFVMAGETFGADLLVYPGDPLLYHASHMIVLLESPGAVQPLQLVAKLRLSVFVKKLFVYAYFAEGSIAMDDTDYPEVRYQTVEWEGNLQRDLTDS